MSRALPFVGVALIAGGLLLLGALGWSIWSPSPAPYGYRMVAEGKAETFPELGLEGRPNLAIRKYEVRVPEVDKPIADLHVARPDDADPVLLTWRNLTAEPLVTISSKASETRTLAKAIAKHAPSDALILGWWDTSRRLQLLARSEVLFDENLSRPVLVPSMWNGRRASIEALERDFWRVPAAAETADKFEAFLDALLSDEVVGAAKLRQLAGRRQAYVVLHVSDAFKLGAIEPARLAVGYKDFGNAGQLHGQVRRIKDWVKGQGHEAYAVLPLGDQVRRVFFLSDAVSTETLMARLLPFSSSNPFAVREFALVYQHGGYWVYRLRTAKQQASSGGSGTAPKRPLASAD